MEEPNIRLRALEPEDLDFLYQIENDDQLWETGCAPMFHIPARCCSTI